MHVAQQTPQQTDARLRRVITTDVCLGRHSAVRRRNAWSFRWPKPLSAPPLEPDEL
jgi:hypothetical protein